MSNIYGRRGFRASKGNGQLTEQKEQKTRTISWGERTKIQNTVKDFLVSNQRCSRSVTSEYNMIVYGDDLNVIDSSRQWLYDELMVEEKKINPDVEPEHVRILANKMVLFINRKEYEQLCAEREALLLAQ